MFPKADKPYLMPVEDQLASLLEAAGDAVFHLDGDGAILHVSRRTLTLLSLTESVIGRKIADLVPLTDRAALLSALQETLDTLAPARVNARLHAMQSTFRWFEWQVSAYAGANGKPEILAVGRDITAQHANEERLRHMATHDVLTGLPNRALLSDRIKMALAQARRVEDGFAVVALDLDGFKKVNDALGHAVGDALLCVAAQRLREALRDIDTLARVGGDEFVAVLPGMNDETAVLMVARRLISALQLPFEIDGHTLYISTSIGGAIYPEHGDSEVKLLAHADTAMYRAKETGKARCVVYSHQKFTQPEHDVSMEAAMFDAIRNGEFLLHYQPIVDASTRMVVGFEALMRWTQPDFGTISPAQFIPMAEGNGLINLLGCWALKAACVQIKRFEQIVGRRLYVSVNVSPRQFRNDQFLQVIDDALTLSELQGDQLLLEITEGILMSDPEHAEGLLKSIAARKVRIAIDDFGTGYSSLAYLKRFPIHALKIDRAFIKDLPASVKDAAICNVVLSLANHLKLSTVAEGVENEQQLQYLASQGCNLIQGFFTGEPLLPERALELLKNGTPLPLPAMA